MHNYYWKHQPTDLIYAVQIENDVIVAAFGGIMEQDATPENLASFNFPSDPEDVAWINNHREEFSLIQ